MTPEALSANCLGHFDTRSLISLFKGDKARACPVAGNEEGTAGRSPLLVKRPAVILLRLVRLQFLECLSQRRIIILRSGLEGHILVADYPVLVDQEDRTLVHADLRIEAAILFGYCVVVVLEKWKGELLCLCPGHVREDIIATYCK